MLKKKNYWACLVAGIPRLLILVSLPILAKAKGTNVYITQKLSLNQTELDPGNYTAQISEKDGGVEIELFKGKNSVAKAKAQKVTTSYKSPRSFVKTSNEGGKGVRLVGLVFEGDSFEYQFAQ